jgi:hypothetical protein
MSDRWSAVGGQWPFSGLLFLLLIAPMRADDAERIIRESDRRQQVKSQSYDGQLEVVDPGGKVFKKSWKMAREGNGSTSKVLVRFTSPPEVDGVGLLILARPNAPDDQWMYTPAIRRDRRIAAQDRSARFMGTDFSHEDMEQRDIEEYSYELLGEEAREGLPCWKIRARAKNAGQSQYSWSDIRVRKDNYLVVFIEMYVKEALRKVLELTDVAQIQGIWTARLLKMQDLQRRGGTTIRLQNIKYGDVFPPDFFSLRTLRNQ